MVNYTTSVTNTVVNDNTVTVFMTLAMVTRVNSGGKWLNVPKGAHF